METAYHAARLVALHSAMLSLLTEFADDIPVDTVHARLSVRNRKDPNDFAVFDLSYSSNGVAVGGEGW